MRYFIVSIVIICLYSCKNDNKPLTNQQAFKQLKSLEGDWILNNNVNNFENWQVNEDQIIGSGYTIQEGDSILSELYAIEFDEVDSLSLEVNLIQNQSISTIHYKLKDAIGTTFTFQTNERLFPNELVYHFTDDKVELTRKGMIENQFLETSETLTPKTN